MNQKVFKRKIYAKMLEWKQSSNGKTALLLQGARRIGKSTVAEHFARNEYDDYLIIDFSNAEEKIVSLFNHVSDINRFFLELRTLTAKSLPERKSVIIFDEIQFCPKARQAIKHLVADGRYDYIETGSLISIRKNVKDILIPSEERRLDMHPLDFEEFLWAIGNEVAFEMIRMCFDRLEPLGEHIHRKIMYDFRLYMLIGGMPQAINAFLDKNDFEEVDAIKRDILDLYDADFRKIDPLGRASTIFNAIPAELSRSTMRYKVGSVIEGSRPSRLGEIFADIADSKTVSLAYHTDDPAIGMSWRANPDCFKMFLADTGLFITLAFKDRDYTDNEIYRKLLLDKLPANLGYIYENVVAQMLSAAGHRLFYYTFRERIEEDKKPRSYEIDFLISRRDKICPIEVKSSGYQSHKSLDEFHRKYSHRISTQYVLYTKDLRKEGDLIYLPVYMTGLL